MNIIQISLILTKPAFKKLKTKILKFRTDPFIINFSSDHEKKKEKNEDLY